MWDILDIYNNQLLAYKIFDNLWLFALVLVPTFYRSDANAAEICNFSLIEEL